MSADKKAALEQELQDLKTSKIPAIARHIDEARQMGDLSENAEYHAAREDMAWARGRAQEIETILENVVVISEDSGKQKRNTAVQLGSVIVVSFRDKQKEYSIVGAQEADPTNGKISNESPLGQAFLGKEKGDVIEVEVPAGVLSYTILEIK
jgi:transcription elongation factor GreA